MRRHHPPGIFAVFAAVTLFLTINQSEAQTATNIVQLQNGRMLAAACMQCHSSSGFESISGESAGEIISEMREMKTKKSPGIMEMIARGYTDLQVKDLAAYLAAQPKGSGGGGESEEQDD